MAHGDARDGKWRGNWWMEWVASTFTLPRNVVVSSITNADAHTSAASSRLNPAPIKMDSSVSAKDGIFCTCAITFQTDSTKIVPFLAKYLDILLFSCILHISCSSKGHDMSWGFKPSGMWCCQQISSPKNMNCRPLRDEGNVIQRYGATSHKTRILSDSTLRIRNLTSYVLPSVLNFITDSGIT